MPSEEKEITQVAQDTAGTSPTGESGCLPLADELGIADKYDVTRLIGRGSSGDIYEAKQLILDRMVALKFMQERTVNEVAVKRFAKEAKVISSLNHPNIVSVFDSDITEDQRPFLVMELLDGRSVSEILKTGGPLSPPVAIHAFVQACEGMAHAHEHNVLHRDIKPSNLMLANVNSQQVLKVIDFGIAKRTDEDRATNQSLTRTGEIIGTTYYMSPEQCTDNKTDERSDIYSLGCALYEALSGKPPFVGDNAYETISMHLEAAPPPLVCANGSFKNVDALELVVLKAIAKDPDDRFQSMIEMRDALLVAASANDNWFSPFQTTWQRRTKTARKPTLSIPLILTLMLFCLLLAQSISIVQQRTNEPVNLTAEGKWIGYNRTGQKQIDAGYYHGAAESFQQAVQLSSSFSHDNDAAIWRDRHLLSIEKQALAMSLDNQTADAQGIKTKLASHRRAKAAEDIARDTVLLDLWKAYPAQSTQVDSNRFVATADQLVELCHRYIDQHKYKEAQAILASMLQKSKDVLGNDSLTVASILHEQGRLFNRLHRYREAVNVLEQSLTIRGRLMDKDSVELGKSWYNLSVAKENLHDTKSAMEALHKAMDSYLKNDYTEGLAYGAEQKGLILAQDKDYTSALASLNGSLHLMRKNGDYQGLRDCVDQICYVLSRQNPDTREHFLTEQLNNLTDDRNADVDRAFYNERLAALHEQKGKLQLAAREYRAALSIQQINLAPSDPRVLELLRNYIRVEGNLGESKVVSQFVKELVESEHLSANEQTK